MGVTYAKLITNDMFLGVNANTIIYDKATSSDIPNIDVSRYNQGIITLRRGTYRFIIKGHTNLSTVNVPPPGTSPAIVSVLQVIINGRERSLEVFAYDINSTTIIEASNDPVDVTVMINNNGYRRGTVSLTVQVISLRI